ncbi:MAG TPA: aldolase/citrate lyase family protein [Synergistaceae bacterium]|nr:aldolase/citrate lyase family protein [Synergistaceae bacterium]HQF91005.1 aldolase/citrate lyase family protein [Synergistaceae bacterium]HQH77774.1 aldolase/citrate lyase family protein [Synergistaceae bacterium]
MSLRRTMLYLPGNNPNMLLRGHLFRPDGLILDLEDAVAPSEKDAARILVRDVLCRGEFGGCEVTVRINGMDTELWREDVAAVVPAGATGLRVPKVENPRDIRLLDEYLGEVESQAGIAEGRTAIFCLLETALGIWRAYDIATASPRVAALIPGGEDLTADLRTNRSADGTELATIRSLLVVAARAAGVDALDTVYPRVADDEGLRREVAFIKQLGFDGKSVIHPNQIPIVHDIFTPTEAEVEKAKRIVAAARDAAARGLGAVQVDGRMVDKPVVRRAEFTLSRAGLSGEVM